MGLMQDCLAMEVCQGNEEFPVTHGKYASDILNKFHMESRKPMETPLVGN